MKIHVAIDRLVLDGFAFTAKERAELRSSVEAELSQLIRAGGASPSMRSGGATPSITAPPIQTTRSAAHTGQNIARSVFRGMGGS
jgi:hypothetical protein